MSAPKYEFGGKCFPAAGAVSQDEKTWSIVAHVSPIITGFVGLPFLGPLIVWLVKKEESDFIRLNALHALAWSLLVFVAIILYVIVSIILTCIGIGVLMMALGPILSLAILAYLILGAVNASNGYVYAYPLSGEFVKEKPAGPGEGGEAGGGAEAGGDPGKQPGFPHAEDDQPRGPEPPSEPPRQS